jgi:hypothetical protein
VPDSIVISSKSPSTISTPEKARAAQAYDETNGPFRGPLENKSRPGNGIFMSGKKILKR